MNIHSQTPDPRSNGSAGSKAEALDPTLTVESLAGLGCRELDQRYRSGLMFDLARLDGAPRGRMLAIVGLDQRPQLARIAALAAAPKFPWRGKSFQSHGEQQGAGINRVLMLGDQFPFDTLVEASAIDGAPCVRLDYDKPENPFFIRAIRDELREVAPDLFLGPAMLDGANPRLILWFAIDHQGR